MNLVVCILVFVIGLLLLTFNSWQYFILQNKTSLTKILSLYLIVSAIEGIVCFGLYFVFPVNNFFLSHFFFNIQLLFLGLFFYFMLPSKSQKRFVLFSSIIVFVSTMLQYSLNFSTFWQFNLFEIIGVCCLLISFGLIHLYNTIGDKKMFYYFSLGMIMYFLCTCIIYLFGGFTLVFLQDPYIDHWIIKDVFFIIFQLLIFKELQLLKKQQNAQ